MKSFFRIGICLAYIVYSWTIPSFGVVQVETEPYPYNNSIDKTILREALQDSISGKAWDRYHFKFLMPRDSGMATFELSASEFARLSSREKERVLEHLMSYHNRGDINAYTAKIDVQKNKLDQEAVIERLGIDTKDFKGVIPAEKLLSTYAQKWAYQVSEKPGANCWHTSMASIGVGWVIPRRMLPPEFICHLKEEFKPIDEPSQWGDLIRLSDDGGEVHGFTYLGTDSSDPTRKIVFTKNGYMVSRFLFMDLESVRTIYSGTEVSFFRSVKLPVDPMADPHAVCAKRDTEIGRADDADPLIVHALRTASAHSHPVIAF